jgi:hypothetical protein
MFSYFLYIKIKLSMILSYLNFKKYLMIHECLMKCPATYGPSDRKEPIFQKIVKFNMQMRKDSKFSLLNN